VTTPPATNAPPTPEPAPALPVPRWVAPLFVLGGVGLLPWTLWLAYDLPERHVARHWDVAWVGFDAALAVLLLLTAITAVRRSAWIQSAAAASATMLLCDAWFDCVTAGRGVEFAAALAQGFLVELPLAIVCLRVARNAEHAHAYLAAAARFTRRVLPR